MSLAFHSYNGIDTFEFVLWCWILESSENSSGRSTNMAGNADEDCHGENQKVSNTSDAGDDKNEEVKNSDFDWDYKDVLDELEKPLDYKYAIPQFGKKSDSDGLSHWDGKDWISLDDLEKPLDYKSNIFTSHFHVITRCGGSRNMAGNADEDCHGENQKVGGGGGDGKIEEVKNSDSDWDYNDVLDELEKPLDYKYATPQIGKKSDSDGLSHWDGKDWISFDDLEKPLDYKYVIPQTGKKSGSGGWSHSDGNDWISLQDFDQPLDYKYVIPQIGKKSDSDSWSHSNGNDWISLQDFDKPLDYNGESKSFTSFVDASTTISVKDTAKPFVDAQKSEVGTDVGTPTRSSENIAGDAGGIQRSVGNEYSSSPSGGPPWPSRGGPSSAKVGISLEPFPTSNKDESSDTDDDEMKKKV